ncbi:SMEK domain-containing protein [Paracoccus aminovorans]|uniref:SMEK domain-containing protein n=1 Tax=Paracoccus aminovorans TaxID=34004 RepID=UPI000A9A803A|nr:SMEK domain-containing protein [Paracoccus aminovorans]
MTARGAFVGPIIDDLDTISSRVRARSKLGFTDLNRILEDFFKELLNLIYTANLVNLNEIRRNAPGLDLGDTTSTTKRAFQVTSQASSQKINDTLEAISDADAALYDEIYVLIIGEPQAKYSLNPAQVERVGFQHRSIIGMTELASRIIASEIDTIRSVYEKLRAELQRITVELEVAIDGKFETSLAGLVEDRPAVNRSDASLLFAYDEEGSLFTSREEAQAALDGFVDRLELLPRMTRQFLGWLLDNTDLALGLDKPGIFSTGVSVNADLVARKHSDQRVLHEDIRLLRSWKFVDYDDDGDGNSPRVSINFPGAHGTSLYEALPYFLVDRKLSAETLFSTMNFTVFGPPPAALPPVPAKKKKQKEQKTPRKK